MQKRKTYIIILSMLFSLFFSMNVNASQQISSNIDAVMIIDVSGSMRFADPNGVSNEAIKMFVDMMSEKGNRIGLVAFSDRIERERELREINGRSEKEEFKNFVDTLKPIGNWTDSTVGIDRGIKFLKTANDIGNKPLIVVLADGNNDLNPRGGRTYEQSDSELEIAIKDAVQQGYPVYTIGLNYDGSLNSDYLKDISKRTGAQFFETTHADDLPQILSNIFANHLSLKQVKLATLEADGEFQNIKIPIPNSNVKEANISIMTSKDVELKLYGPSGRQYVIPANDIFYSRSAAYHILKIISPEQGEWTLGVKGVQGDKIDINLIFDLALELEMKSIPSSINEGTEIKIEAYFTEQGEKIDETSFYNNVDAKFQIKNNQTQDVTEVKLTNIGNSFNGAYTFDQEGEFTVSVLAEHTGYTRQTKEFTIKVIGNNKGLATQVESVEQEGESEKKRSIFLIILLLLLAIIAIILIAILLAHLKKKNKGFVGQFVIEIRDENTGKKTSPQYKKLNAFRGKVSLHELLQLVEEFSETSKIDFRPSENDTIKIINKSQCVIKKSGRNFDASKGVNIKNNDRLEIILNDTSKSILMEYVL